MVVCLNVICHKKATKKQLVVQFWCYASCILHVLFAKRQLHKVFRCNVKFFEFIPVAPHKFLHALDPFTKINKKANKIVFFGSSRTGTGKLECIVADPKCLFPDPESEFLHPGSPTQGQKDSGYRIRTRIKEFKYFLPKKLFLSSRKYDSDPQHCSNLYQRIWTQLITIFCLVTKFS